MTIYTSVERATDLAKIAPRCQNRGLDVQRTGSRQTYRGKTLDGDVPGSSAEIHTCPRMDFIRASRCINVEESHPQCPLSVP